MNQIDKGIKNIININLKKKKKKKNVGPIENIFWNVKKTKQKQPYHWLARYTKKNNQPTKNTKKKQNKTKTKT